MTETLNNPLITRNPIQLQTIQGQINSQIDDINNQVKLTNEKIKSSSDQISKLDEDIIELKIEGSEQKDIVTFKFVADEFGTGINNVAKWFIFVIIAVFDPLAIVLLIAANMSIGNIKDIPSVKKKDNSNNNINSKTNISDKKDSSMSLHVDTNELDKSTETNIQSYTSEISSSMIIKEIEKPVEVIKEIEKPVEVIKRKNGTSGLFSF